MIREPTDAFLFRSCPRKRGPTAFAGMSVIHQPDTEREGGERQLTVDPVAVGAWLVSVFRVEADTEALHHAFVCERDESLAQLFIEAYRVILARSASPG